MTTHWHEEDGLRIWRVPGLRSEKDEILKAGEAFTDERLAAIATRGFNAVWIFCDMYDLMESTIFPELNRPSAAACGASVQQAIDRAAAHGLGVYLYFNEPGGVRQDHRFWESHQHLRGDAKWGLWSLCTSTPEVQAFFRQALTSIFERLQRVAGVILITACENLTHCWSKRRRRAGDNRTDCPRCQSREPADLIIELLRIWAEVRDRQAAPFRILAWNWEWAYYYDDPPATIIDRLPPGVELLLDMEIGGTHRVDGREIPIGEYALSYAGPSPRLTTSRAIAGARRVHAKIQPNSTHELCTVPNVPVLATLHAKLVAMSDQQLNGYMGCWNIGCAPDTLNARALQLFCRDPERYRDAACFLHELAHACFPGIDSAPIVAAWRAFSDGFAHYPFCVPMLYFGPFNDAPARLLSLDYEGRPLGRSYEDDPIGDDLTACLGPWSIDEVIAATSRMVEGWEAGLRHYRVLPEGHPEWRVAQMIGLQLRSAWHAVRFHAERQRLLQEHALTPPCRLPADPALIAIMQAEIANARQALPLVEADPRLGFHESYQGHKYTAPAIHAKLARMQQDLQA